MQEEKMIEKEDVVYAALQKCSLFKDMTQAEIADSLSGFSHRTVDYGKQEIFALPGAPCRYADIVVSGTLVCRMMSLSGKQVEVSRLRSGSMVAPAFLFASNGAMPVSVMTDDKVTVLRMSKEVFENMLDSDSHLRMNFIRTLSDIDVFLTAKMRFLSLMTVKEKVAWLLKERAREQKNRKITLYRSRQEIADSFGIQKYSLIRSLSDLEKEGVISIEGRDITILKWEGLG